MADKINKNNVVSTNNNLKDGVSSGVVDKQSVESSKLDVGKKINSSAFSISSNGFGIFKIVIFLLIFISIIRILRDSFADVPTFESLLDLLHNVPQLSDDFLNFSRQLPITSDWGLLNEFRYFINSLIDFWSVMMWISAGIVDFFLFISYFLFWIFV